MYKKDTSAIKEKLGRSLLIKIKIKGANKSMECIDIEVFQGPMVRGEDEQNLKDTYVVRENKYIYKKRIKDLKNLKNRKNDIKDFVIVGDTEILIFLRKMIKKIFDSNSGIIQIIDDPSRCLKQFINNIKIEDINEIESVIKYFFKNGNIKKFMKLTKDIVKKGCIHF